MRSDGRAILRHAGRYLVGAEIASGGMASVHLGRLIGPVGFRRTVAIKRLHPSYAEDPDFVAMFMNEARLAARIAHPNVATTLDVASEGGSLVLIMEYVHGASLSRLLARASERGSKVPLAVASSIAVGALHGLHAAHEARGEGGDLLGIVHRDVSPHNVMVGADGITRVVDFGIAKAVSSARTTRQGQLKGKLSYMAPEQLRGERLDRRADVFALGIVLWEMCSGRRLFGDGRERVFAGADAVPRLDSIRADLPAGLDVLVQRALAPDRALRFETAREMATALERLVTPASTSEVGDWVARVAAADLEARAEELAELERGAAAGIGAFEVGRPGDDSAGARVWELPTAVPAPAARTAASEVPAQPDPGSPRGRRGWPIALGVLAATVAAVLVASRLRDVPPSSAAAVTTSEAGDAEAPSTARAIPTVDSSTAAPAPSEPPGTEPTARSPAARTPVGSPPRRPVSNGCDPPYTTDADGVRRYKIECVAPKPK